MMNYDVEREFNNAIWIDYYEGGQLEHTAQRVEQLTRIVKELIGLLPAQDALAAIQRARS
jgi:hypothetical protein